jgi:hypothetical protein
VDEIVRRRKAEADEFYASIHPPTATAEEKAIQRQALAGMLWSKQIYLWDVNRWPGRRQPEVSAAGITQADAQHSLASFNSMRILSMPDKWEFPWFAAGTWHSSASHWSWSNPEFAKENLWVLLLEQFQHPNGPDSRLRVGVFRS